MQEIIKVLTREEKQEKSEKEKKELERKVKEINERLITVFQKYIEKFGKRFEIRPLPKLCIYDHKRSIEAVCVYDESKGRIPIHANSDHEDLPTFLKQENFNVVETNDLDFAILIDDK